MESYSFKYQWARAVVYECTAVMIMEYEFTAVMSLDEGNYNCNRQGLTGVMGMLKMNVLLLLG